MIKHTKLYKLTHRELMVLRIIEEARLETLEALRQHRVTDGIPSRQRVCELMREREYDQPEKLGEGTPPLGEHKTKIARAEQKLVDTGLITREPAGPLVTTYAGARFVEALTTRYGIDPTCWPTSTYVEYDPDSDVVHYHMRDADFLGRQLWDTTDAVHGPVTEAMEWINREDREDES